VEGEVTHVRPGGNAPGWGGRQWLYFPEEGYSRVRDIIGEAIQREGCGHVVLHGFSNGAAAAAKLYCRGERFGGTLRGVIVDDPVTDPAVKGCKPSPGVALTLYWTGGLRDAHDGFRCVAKDWTCEGETTLGIEKYAELLRTKVTSSVEREHRVYASPPEHRLWW
jgi:hypothetical protein